MLEAKSRPNLNCTFQDIIQLGNKTLFIYKDYLESLKDVKVCSITLFKTVRKYMRHFGKISIQNAYDFKGLAT